MELIRLVDIRKTYHLGEVDVPVLRGISLSIRRGELVALMGASGSGKTTLMNILGCLDHPSGGQYWLDGKEMSRLSPNERAVVRTEKLGFVFQNFNLLPRTSAVRNVMMPLDYALPRPSMGAARSFARRLLERVGLADRMEHEPSQMSGGQQQRVAIGRSLVNRPALVLADEPTGNLDSKTSVEILEMFRQLNAEGITILLVTHDPKVASYADRVITIRDGELESDERRHPSPGNGQPHTAENGAGENGAEAAENGHGRTLPGRAVRHAHSVRPEQGEAIAAGPAVATLAPPTATGESRADARPGAKPLPLFAQPERRCEAFSLGSLLPATFRTALGALRRNKMRSLLTALGVIIGVGAVITMMEIGQGSSKDMQKTIASMGANTLLVQSGAASSGGVNYGIGSVLTLTPHDAQEIARQCPAVQEVAPLVRSRTQIVYNGRNWVPVFIYGTTPSYLAVRDWEELTEGDMFNERDVVNGSQVCVVGETIRRQLFQNESPVGKEIRIQNVAFRVVGVLSRKGANTMGMDQDDVVMAPWTTIKYRVSGSSASTSNQSAAASKDTTQKVNTLSERYPGGSALYPVSSASQQANTPQPVRFINIDQIMVKAASAEEIPAAISQITDLMRERHRLRKDQVDDFNIRDMTEMNNAAANTSRLMSGLLLAVACISLVVGGVGIMNIMLVSVTERTREIGLRMAVGARDFHILSQFLVEAVVLCLLGGAFGVLLGRGASEMVRMTLRWTTEISLPAILVAFAVSAGIGIVFGFYPAWKASRLDPIEALRYE